MEKLLELIKKREYYKGKTEVIKNIENEYSEVAAPIESEITGEKSAYYNDFAKPIVKEYKKQGFDAKDKGYLETIESEIGYVQKQSGPVDVNSIIDGNEDIIYIHRQIGRLKKLLELSKTEGLSPEIQTYIEGALETLEESLELDSDLINQIKEARGINDGSLAEVIEQVANQIEEESAKIQKERSAAIGRGNIYISLSDKYNRKSYVKIPSFKN